MKMLISTVAVLGALAIGGVPAVAFTLAQAEHGLADTSSSDAAGDKPGNGPPEWANSRHNGQKDSGQKDMGRRDDAKGAKKDKANRHAAKMSSLGRAHGEAMRMWAACVSENAGDKSACDPKPVPPGHLKHPEKR